MKTMILPAIGAALLAAGCAVFYWQYSLVQGKAIAEGRVTQLIPSRGSKGGTVYAIVAEFRDYSGKACTYKSHFSSSNPGYKVGDSIRIFFDRRNPAACGIMSFGYRFGAAWCIIVAGLACLALWAGWEYGNQWLANQFPTNVRL